jgi:hypothetical protein
MVSVPAFAPMLDGTSERTALLIVPVIADVSKLTNVWSHILLVEALVCPAPPAVPVSLTVGDVIALAVA